MEEMIKTLDMGELRPEEFDAWCELCGRIFPREADYFRGHFTNDPDANLRDIFVARKDGELVGSVRLFTRSAWLNGRAVRVGGIGEVCTDPAARGLGVSFHLLDLAMKRMDERGWELSTLYTGRHAHYARHGFEVVPRYYKEVAAEELPVLKSEYAVRAFEKADIDALMGIYDLYSSQFELAYRREKRAYWENYVCAAWQNPMVLVEDGCVKAYAEVSEKDGVVFLRDAGAIPGEDAALGTVIRACAEKLGAARVVMPAPVLAGVAGKALEPNRGLMVRMKNPAAGYEDVQALIPAAEQYGVQWACDGF